jgi:predicted nuclease of restriction endonuclease-like (RecB) superfamily
VREVSPAIVLVTGTVFGRIATIVDQARVVVAQSVGQEMVLAYWHIGREIVEAMQGGEERADYGVQLIEALSVRLTARYGKGFSASNLRNFRQFYVTYSTAPPGSGSHRGSRSRPTAIRYPGSELAPGVPPRLGWSHYRALMRVEKTAAREFYEREAVACGWSKLDLDRQIATQYYERRLKSRRKRALPLKRRPASCHALTPIDVLKDPYVLEFLALPESPHLHESDLDAAIIDKLQQFLLELGRGFSLASRQKHMRFGDEDFYVDLVFYNYLLRCFVLIDLKTGALTHQDIGQMDGYVRMFDARAKPPGDNPTIGLILCSSKNQAIARYSVLHESRHLFAAKYLTYLPSEDELQRELRRERSLLEARRENGPS